MTLVIVGGVMSANAKTIYFIDNWGRTNLQLHAWNSDTDNNDWVHLTETCYIGKSDGWFNCYKLDLGDYEQFLIYHNEYDGRTQTPNLLTSNFEDGKYYEYYYDSSDGNEKLREATLYTYNFTVTTSSTWNKLYIHLWNPENNNSTITGKEWPGIELTGEGNVYSFTFKAYISNNIGVIFNKGDGAAQTCNMTASTGDNNYYIASVNDTKQDDAWGEAVKTNGSGYATYVSTKNLTIPANTAYCAEDNNNGTATAHSVTKPAGTTAMLIKGNPNTTYHFGTRSASDNETLAFTNAFKAGDDSNVASYESETGPYNYILNGNTFYAAAGKKVAKGKAYLQLTVLASSSSPALIFADGETTGIHLISTVDETDNYYYNLQGDRIANPTKGIYIKNGKKVIIK